MPNSAENHYIHQDIHDLQFKIVVSFGMRESRGQLCLNVTVSEEIKI